MKRHWNKPSIKSITAAFSKSSKRTSQVNGSDYQYIALPSPRCIRLIELRSSKEAKQIAISLTVHDLNSAPPFDALSYTWNDPNSAYLEAPFVARHVSYGEATYDITCDNHLFRVHANLYDALRFLQDMPARVCGRSRPKYFWIDAICIDQSNLSERAEQVALMSDLYRGAKNIIAWLGPQDATTKQAFKTMEILRPLLDPNLPVSGADVARLEKAYGHIAPSDFFDTSIYNTKLGIKPITLEMWASFALLVHRPWFERVWVVQEVTLAKTISLVCGLDYIDWDDLARIIWFLLAVKWDPFVSPYTLRGHFERNSQSMFRLMGRGLEHGGQEPLQLTIVRTFTRSVGPYKLDDLLERLRFCKATNPRDKVFALRNIANPADGVLGTYGSLISPDYGIAIELLYIRVTKAIINARGDLKILNAKESDSQRELKSLPSWVPDYSVLQLPGPLTEIVHEANWNANGSYNAGPIGGDLDSPFLGVKGVRLAIVEETATEFIEPNGELLGPWLSIIELALGSEDIWQANDGL